MRSLTSTDGDSISHFNEIDESRAELNNTSLEHLLVNNYDVAADRRKIDRYLPLEDIFGFCRTFN